MGKYVKAKLSTLSPEKKQKLLSMGGVVKDEYIVIDSEIIKGFTHNTICKNEDNDEFTHNTICNNTEDLHTIPYENTKEKIAKMWEEYPFTDNIDTLRRIKRFGLPETKAGRQKMLICFASTNGDNYPLTYEGICKYYPEFSEKYSKDYVVDLVKRVVVSKAGLYSEIEAADINDEEKALLKLVLPISV